MEPVQWSLPNGIRVLEIYLPNSPILHISWNVHAGAAHESIPGLAHLCEHLMFTGTPKIPEYDSYLSSLDADNNAWTNYNYTSYEIETTPSHLERILAVEADRICNLAPSLKETVLTKERNVVCNEYQEGIEEDAITRLFHAQSSALFGKKHPY